MDSYTKACFLASIEDPSLWRESKEGRHLLEKINDPELLDGLRYLQPTEKEILGVAGMGVFNEMGFKYPFSERQAHGILVHICNNVGADFCYRLGQILTHLSKADLQKLVHTKIALPRKDQDFFKENLKDALCHKLKQKDPESLYCASLMVDLARKWLGASDTNEMHFYYLVGSKEDCGNLDKALDLSIDAQQFSSMRSTMYKVLHQKYPIGFSTSFSTPTWTAGEILDFLTKARDKWGVEIVKPENGWFQLNYLEAYKDNICYYQDVCGVFGLDPSADTKSVAHILEIDFTSIIEGKEYCKTCLEIGATNTVPLSFSFSRWNSDYIEELHQKKDEVLKTWELIQNDKHKDVVPYDFKFATFCLLVALGVERLPEMEVSRFFDFPKNESWREFVSNHVDFDSEACRVVEGFKQTYDNLKTKHELNNGLKDTLEQKKPLTRKM